MFCGPSCSVISVCFYCPKLNSGFQIGCCKSSVHIRGSRQCPCPTIPASSQPPGLMQPITQDTQGLQPFHTQRVGTGPFCVPTWDKHKYPLCPQHFTAERLKGVHFINVQLQFHSAQTVISHFSPRALRSLLLLLLMGTEESLTVFITASWMVSSLVLEELWRALKTTSGIKL